MQHSPHDSNNDQADQARQSLENALADFFPANDGPRPIISGDGIVISLQGIPTPNGEYHWQYSIAFPLHPERYDKPLKFRSATVHHSRPTLIDALKSIYAFLLKIQAVEL